MMEDAELLRRYAGEKSEAAFAELVRRHISFVHGCALRRVGGDAHLAEDVAQQVFTALARSAASLVNREVLSGWLYTTARNASAQVVRGERRRRTREQEAHTMNELTLAPGHDAEWERLRPAIDGAMDELRDTDREALLLRFFEGKSFAAVGVRLRLTENTARMRVERALEKMHASLARRGVTSTTSALAVALANQAAASAPAGLAATVAIGALAGVEMGAAAVGWGVFAFMSTAKITIGLVSAVATVGICAALLGATKAQDARAALAAAVREQAMLAASLGKLESRMQSEARRVQAAEEENARLLSVAEKLKSAAPVVAEAEPVTSGMVSARWKRAQELAKDGDPATALRELLWCYDIGMVQVSSMSAVRSSAGTSALAKLGERYPPALDALRERRDKARERVLAGESDYETVSEFGAINRAMKNDAANISFFDQLPPGDRRRRTLASISNDYLVENQRYKDAAEGRPYSMISSLFETMIQERSLPATVPNPDEIRRNARESVVRTTAKGIEMLAGSGDLAHARMLAQRLLAYDSSEATKAVIQKHLERAGQPALMAPAPKL